MSYSRERNKESVRSSRPKRICLSSFRIKIAMYSMHVYIHLLYIFMLFKLHKLSHMCRQTERRMLDKEVGI